jgi:hypothetical protein
VLISIFSFVINYIIFVHRSLATAGVLFLSKVIIKKAVRPI